MAGIDLRRPTGEEIRQSTWAVILKVGSEPPWEVTTNGGSQVGAGRLHPCPPSALLPVVPEIQGKAENLDTISGYN